MTSVLVSAFAYLDVFIEWMREGLSYALPAKARSIWYKPSHIVKALDPKLNVKAKFLIEQSFLGEIRETNVNEDECLKTLHIHLHPSCYHVFQVVVPKSSKGQLSSAVALQLAALSPVHLSHIVYTYKIAGKDVKQRLLLDVVICRKEIVEAALLQYGTKFSSVQVIAIIRWQTSRQFKLCHQNNKTVTSRQLPLSAIGITASLVLLATGVQAYYSKIHGAYSHYEQELIGAIKSNVKYISVLEGDLELANAQNPRYSYHELSSNIANALAAAPPAFVVAEATVKKETLTIIGFAPIGERAHFKKNFETSHFTESIYPGYDRVVLSIMIGEVQS